MFSTDTASIVYSYFFVFVTILAGLSLVARHTIAKYTDELKDKLSKIEGDDNFDTNRESFIRQGNMTAS